MRRIIFLVILFMVSLTIAGCIQNVQRSGDEGPENLNPNNDHNDAPGIEPQNITQDNNLNDTASRGEDIYYVTPDNTLNYTVGDVFIEYPGDLIGHIILSYNLDSSSYTVRPIIMDIHGETYFLGNQTRINIDREIFEIRYTIKLRNYENPFALETMIQKFQEKYVRGDVVATFMEPYNGILILRYDYSQDVYSYLDVMNVGREWVFSVGAHKTGDRREIERTYTKIVAKYGL